jgi:predicted O-methyltransferase YrrM
MRYDQLHQAVAFKKPRAILEIGTWNGMRALNMLTICPTAKYYGFDLFEDATDETDKAEFNVKPHNALDDVYYRLKDFDVTLHKGNTNETLPRFTDSVDFVWIDGGHSVDTIRNDWQNVARVIAPDAWVFFDDYYSGGIDTSLMGCNTIVAPLKHEILPMRDKVSGGGFVQMVRVFP